MRARVRTSIAVTLLGAVAIACTASTAVRPQTTRMGPPAKSIFKLEHLIFIVQENRSFDQYFGTYPGADGIPTDADGNFTVCVPDRFQGGVCVPPYVTHRQEQTGGLHAHAQAVIDVDRGKMDGFIQAMPSPRSRAGRKAMPTLAPIRARRGSPT
jgi:phospholipase C